MAPSADNPSQAIEAAFRTAAIEGRKVLVILGAGCSVAAGIPQMRDIYKHLESELRGSILSANEDTVLRSLTEWLNPLAKGQGARSLAAKALGTLQSPPLSLPSNTRDAIDSIWHRFSEDFMSGRIAINGIANESPIWDKEPTPFHQLVAKWAHNGLVYPVSVNFDGLTCRAIQNFPQSDTTKQNAPPNRCLVLNHPDHIQRFILRRPQSGTPKFIPLIKVWGDVFHAVCQHSGCTDFELPVPIYGLTRYHRHQHTHDSHEQTTIPSSDLSALLKCPECQVPRRLLIYFPGYQRKDEDTELLIDTMSRYIWPSVSSVIIAGLSGVWDSALLKGVSKLSHSLQNDTTLANLIFRTIVIDRDSDCYAASELRSQGVRVTHITNDLQEIAKSYRSETSPLTASLARDLTHYHIADIDPFWKPLWEDSTFPYSRPSGYQTITSNDYLEHFRRLRQLGIKTRLVTKTSEDTHNRRLHSVGVAHLSLFWINALLTTPSEYDWPFDESLLPSMVFFAASHHDIGHMPFTHLAEEVFRELNWTTTAWTSCFRHDTNVLDTCHTTHKLSIQGAIAEVSNQMWNGCTPEDFSAWVSRAIEGRSGIPVIDAVLNSPLDADKLDYIFRDCFTLGKSSRVPTEELRRIEWVKNFVENQQRILPSGLLAISGPAAEHARDLLEERRWLYKRLYFQPPFRVLERIARSILTLWLVHMVPTKTKYLFRNVTSIDNSPLINDTRAIKGNIARDILWTRLIELQNPKGEPDLILELADDLLNTLPEETIDTRCLDWILQCRTTLLKMITTAPEGGPRTDDAILDALSSVASWSQRMYCRLCDVPRLRDICRQIEYTSPFSVLVDVAEIPRTLSYPTGATSKSSSHPRGECIAVPSHDPARWGSETGRWVALSETAYREEDLSRLAQILVLSPRPFDSPTIRHAEDRLRAECRRHGISILDEAPDAFSRQ